MNARLYDQVVGRFLSPDPYIQAPDFSQNFNRYSYALNNPLLYTDPNGEWALVDDAIAAAVGGTINLVSNLVQGNVHNIGQGFAYFGVGAAGGLATIYAGTWAGGAVVAGGNDILTQGFTNGFNNISWSDVGTNTLMGSITGYAGGQLGAYLQTPISSIYGNVASPVLREMLMQGSVGIATGFTLNTAMAKINGASWGDALSSGVNGASWGAVTGFASGATSAVRNSYKEGINPLSGTKVVSDRASENFLKHNNSNGRNDDLNISQTKVLQNARATITKNINNLQEGDNAINLKINGVPKILKANVQNNVVRSMNLHSPTTQNPIRNHFNIVRGGNVTWK